MSGIKKLLGVAPQPVDGEDNLYEPSPASLKVAAPDKTNYDHTTFDRKVDGEQHRILVVCTEEGRLPTANGKHFSTGNHPVELFVPLLHLRAAGFSFELATPTGRPVEIEKWALPEEDETVMGIYREMQPELNSPAALTDIADRLRGGRSNYDAVFFPGGHGALLGLPESLSVREVIQWAVGNDKFILAICHGPAALLAADSMDKFPFSGYKMAAFPDKVDKTLPTMGYLPGQLTWFFNERLKALDVEIVNTLATGTCHRDRKLITGDSPLAANEFGKMSAEALLAAVGN